MDAKQEVFRSLKKQILALEGFKQPLPSEGQNLGRINEAFPNKAFPYAGLHEFFYHNSEEATASSAFISGLLSSHICKEQNIVWISAAQKVFPPALRWFGLTPHRVLFLHIKKEKEISWAIQEALTCSSLTAVVGELPEINLTASRRFQLAIEGSGVGCFVLRLKPKSLLTASVSRWHIQPLYSNAEENLPGLGHPRWRVKLLKARNGSPGSWDVEWADGGFRYVSKLAVMRKTLQKQTG